MELNEAQQSAGSDAALTQSVDILRILLDSRKIMLASVLIGLACAWLYLFVAEPRYRADALVQVEDTSASLGSAITQVQSVFDPSTKVSDEKEIIGSRSVLKPVVDELNLQNNAEPNYFPIFGKAVAGKQPALGRILKKVPFLKKYAWSSEKISLGIFSTPASFEGKQLRLLVTKDGGYELKTTIGTLIGQGKVGEVFEVSVGDGMLSLFVRELEAAPGSIFNIVKTRHYSAISELDSQLSVEEVTRGSRLLRISVKDSSPTEAADKANRIANYYLRQNVERHSAEAQKTLEFLKQELPDIRDKLHLAEEELRKFRIQKGSVDIERETGVLLEQGTSTELQRLTLTQKRSELLQRFTKNHPEVLSLDDQISQLDSRLGKLHGTADQLPETQQRILRLTLDAKVQNEFYVNLLNNIQQLEVAKAGNLGNIRIIDPALPPPGSFAPKALLVYGAGIFIGLILGLLVSVAVLFLDQNEHDPIAVERILGVPVFAQVPLSRSRKSKTSPKIGGSIQPLLAITASDDPAIESLRSLRATLHFGTVGAANKVIMITGPKPDVGKTFITANLGFLLGTSGKKVLLIDGDMRRGRLHTYFGFERSPGLSNILSGATLDSVIHSVNGSDLHCITSGDIPPNPAELLMQDSFTELIKQVGDAYDFILVDSPPILAVGDAGIIGQRAGTTLVIAKSGSHKARELDLTMRSLAQAGSRVRGAIINQVTRSGSSYGYYYQYEYYRDGDGKA